MNKSLPCEGERYRLFEARQSLCTFGKKVFPLRPLRIFLLTLLLAAFSSVIAFAERPEVSADHQSFDVATMRYLLDGNVTVRFKERIITADHAQVSLATLEVWAQDHIRLVEGDILFTGQTLYVEGEKSIAHITGGANFERSALAIRSDEAQFNWDTKIADFTGKVQLKQEDTTRKLQHVRYNVVTGAILLTE